MYRIKYKAKEDKAFKIYVEIGMTVCFPSPLEEFFYEISDNEMSYKEWLERFFAMPIGKQMDYLCEIYIHKIDFLSEHLPNILKEERRLRNFLNNYYHKDTPLFKTGLEFFEMNKSDGWVIDIEKYNEEDERVEIIFKDGSVIQLIDGDEISCPTRFVTEEDQKRLFEDIFSFLKHVI